MENLHGSSRNKGRQEKSITTEVWSIVVFGLAVFTLFALLTYWPSDPSWFSNAIGPARNACGKVGAYIASLFLQCFGIGAFLLPAAMVFVAATILKRDGMVRTVGTLGGMAVATMSLTVFLSLQWKYWPYAGTLLLTGGAFGALCADLLLKEFNPLGSSLVSLLVFCLTIALSTPISIARMGGKVLKFTGIILWRITKLLATYLAYIIGLGAVRFAHAFSEFVTRGMENAVKRTRETLEERRRAQLENMKAATKDVTAEVIDKCPAIVAPVADEVAKVDDESAGPAVTEAPNALPELETKEPVKQGRKSKDATEPEILPFDEAMIPGGSKGKETAGDAAARAAEKLAKAAARAAKKGPWKLPLVDFLSKPLKAESAVDRERLIENTKILKQKFEVFDIEGEITAVRPGPVITLYEFKPGPDVKLSKIANLENDVAMALCAQSARILAPLPGKAVVGIEAPSLNRETVYLRELLQHPDFYGQKWQIPIAMGKDIAGNPFLSDLARMPHLLCAGQTGSGKSVFMNGLICSLLYRFTPEDLRLILIDPKFIEFTNYQDIPHLLLPVVDDAKDASVALKWAVREMDRRYRILQIVGAKNLASFNQKVEAMGTDALHDILFAEENQQENASSMSGGDWLEAFEPDESGNPRVGKLPYIVVIIDELAELMMIAKKDVEQSITRLAQKARAAGIHLVAATQRPSTDVVTGLIKANLPSRVTFQLATSVDSKTILDRGGADKLLGKGDMLFIPPETAQLTRLHGAMVSEEEIGKITGFLKSQGKPVYRDEILIDEEAEAEAAEGSDDQDVLFEEAVEMVKHAGHASASYLQRHLKIGYNRAARMVETMESRGIVGPADGSRPRDVLIR